MITRLELSNFQCYDQAGLDLGMWNALVGPSDEGKSAILRGLYALITNQSGDHFIRHGTPSCMIGVTLDSGHIIEWTKARGRSGAYSVIQPDGGERTYEKTNRTVPDEVRDLLRMVIPVAGEDFMPGFARQFDPPFLLGETARRRAQVLGEFDGSNTLIMADGLMRTAQRGAQAEARAQGEAADAATAALERFAWVEAAEEALGEAEGAVAGAVAAQADVAGPARLLDALTHLDGLLPGYETRVAATDTTAAREALAGAVAAQSEADAMRRASAAYEAAEAAEAPLAARVAAYSALPDLTPIAEALADVAAMRAALSALERLGGEERARTAQGAEAGSEVQAAREALTAMIGDVCPTCGGALTAEGLGLA